MEKETALITGASSGIGLELAKLFATDGSNLVLVARREELLNELGKQLTSSHGINVHVVPEDLAKPGAVARIRDFLEEEKIDVDVLVNNAGFGSLGPFLKVPVETSLDMIQVNLTALTHLTRLLLPAIVERNSGGILNVGSTAAFQAGPNMSIYYASKAFVLHFTEALFEELRGTNLKINCLCPGPTITEFQEVAGMLNSPIFRMGPMTAEKVAKVGYRGYRRGKLIVIPGWRNWLGTLAIRFAPRWLVRRVVRGLNRIDEDS